MARWDASPDVFVWRARRCAEAVLYSVLDRQKANVEELAKQRKGLDQLFEHKQLEGVFSRETRAQLATLREFGNIAAHYQLDGGVKQESADGVATHLAGLLREFYALDGSDVPTVVQAYLAALTTRAARFRTPHDDAIAEANGRADSLARQLNALRGDTAHPALAARSRRSVLAAVCAAVFMGAVGYAAGRGSMSPTETPVIDTVPLPIAPTVAPASPVEAPPSPAVVYDASVPVVAPLECPTDMPLVRGEDGAMPFCIDRAPVLMSAYRECMNAGRCNRPAPGFGCNWQNGANELAVNCVTRDEALAYCRWRHPEHGTLPTRNEWSQVHMVARGVHVVPGTNEWVLDGARGTALIRGPRRGRDFAWTPTSAAQGQRDLSFRCVVH